MENMDSLGDQHPISWGFLDNLQLSVGHECYGRPYRISYKEEVDGAHHDHHRRNSASMGT
jgi:hypothetical protein